MKNARYIIVRLLLALAALTPLANADTKSPFEFKLRSHEGREWSQSDFRDKKLVVVAFLGTECPLVKLYGPRLQRLNEEYAANVAVIGINSNTQDSMTEMAAYAKKQGVRFPLLKDVGNRVADQFKAARTPEVFLLDANRQIRYHGRIDDQYGVGLIRNGTERHDLREAIDELLADREVSVPETEAVGCHIGRVKRIAPTGDITYSRDISRLLNRRCVECHREGELAPFPLTSYEDVIGWEDTICEVIEDNRMPPWFANPEHGKFTNDCRLSEDEKQVMYTWVENGMPEGDPADLPEPPKFRQGWRIPKPDQVFYMRDEAFRVPAQGTIDYKHFVVDPQWDEDKYVVAAEARPDNKSVVHHILVYILPPGSRDSRLDKILVGYAPGSTPVLLEEGVALKVEAGSKLLFQMHYTPNGYVQEDRSYAGVKFVDKKMVKKYAKGRVAINGDFRIPAGADSHVVKANYRLPRDEMLLAMTPHMHLRGKSFRYEAVYPDGNKEVLLDIPKYDFNWQLKYILDEPKLLPRGTTINCTATYDNSEANPVNPDAGRSVRWGDQSWEEMMIGFFDTIPTDRRKTKSKIDPSGNYEWKGAMPGKLSLTMKNGFVNGTLTIRGEAIDIEDAVLEADVLAFTATSMKHDGVTLDFEAHVTDDAVRGKVNFNMEAIGRAREFPWVAHKVD